jgi:hypothetical protein
MGYDYVKELIIFDLISNNYEEIDSQFAYRTNSIVLCLTPSSAYYLELKNIEYISFHDLISVKQFSEDILSIYDVVFAQNKEREKHAFFIEVAQYICQLYVIENIINYIDNNNFKYTTYLTDRETMSDKLNLNNNSSLLVQFYQFDRVIKINRKKTVSKYSLFNVIKKKIILM